MNIDALIKETQQLSKDAFARRYPHLFLLWHPEGDAPPPMQFHTEFAKKTHVVPVENSVIQVLALIKAATNPYSDRISVGRARNCDVVLRHPSVSKLHAHVRRDTGGAWTLQDAGSHNGISVGGLPVPSSGSVPLASGDVLTLGAVTLRVVDAEELFGVLTRLAHAAKGT